MCLNKNKVIILGAGISGISAGYHLKKKGISSVVVEKDDNWGGLCGNFKIDGFRFDKAIHLSFTEDDYVKSLFSQSSKYITHQPVSYNYYNGYWLKHPAQNNLFPLNPSEKIKIIKDFIQNNNKKDALCNYEEWLKAQYGNYFSENFPMQYTKKYWGCAAKELSTTWVGNRMYTPNVEEILRGAFELKTPNTYYAKEMRYPEKGGYRSFLNLMADQCDIRLNKKVIRIHPENKIVFFADGQQYTYQKLISSLPLPEMKMLIPSMPDDVKNACSRLQYTNIILVNLGFKRKDIPKYLWFYIYDEDFYPARCNSPSMKSVDNVPEGCSSFQFEIYSTNSNPIHISEKEIIEHVIEKSEKMNLFHRDDILVQDCRLLKYGNVIFYHGMEKDRDLIHNYMKEMKISNIGRFGIWDYLWSDQSLKSSFEIKS